MDSDGERIDRSLGAMVKVLISLRKKGNDSGLNMFPPYLGMCKSKRGLVSFNTIWVDLSPST